MVTGTSFEHQSLTFGIARAGKDQDIDTKRWPSPSTIRTMAPRYDMILALDVDWF